jgi:hypothetical protein
VDQVAEFAIVTKMCEWGYARGEVVEDVIGGYGVAWCGYHTYQIIYINNADIKGKNICPFVLR